MTRYSCGILTVSDKGAKGERKDTSGPALKNLVQGNGYIVSAYEIVPDSISEISNKIIHWTDDLKIDLVITTGGTGLSPSDVTPEATKKLMDREIPGIAELMRSQGTKSTIRAVLSRGLAGTRKDSLIINLPGSERGAVESLKAVLQVLQHAIDKIKGCESDCG